MREGMNPYPASHDLQEKAYQLRCAQQVGLNVPKTTMTTSLRRARMYFKDHSSGILSSSRPAREMLAAQRDAICRHGRHSSIIFAGYRHRHVVFGSPSGRTSACHSHSLDSSTLSWILGTGVLGRCQRIAGPNR